MLVSGQNEVINDEKFIEVTEDTISNLGHELVEIFDTNQNITISNITKMYDSGQNVIGFMVSFNKGRNNFGYAIYDFRFPRYLTEFSIYEHI